MDLAIRRATPRDRRAVLEMVRTNWGGGDYLPHVFDRWVRSRRHPLYVACAGERVVGVARLAWLAPHEAWLETLRVAPRWRRRGVGRALMEYRIARAREKGARRIAFSTAYDNVAIHRAARHLGFRRVAALQRREAQARAGPSPRRAVRRELAALWRLAVAARRPLSRFVNVGFGWRWKPIVRDDLTRAVRRGGCLVVDGPSGVGALAVVDVLDDRDSARVGERPAGSVRTLSVRYLAGSAPSIRSLLGSLRAEASRRGLAKVSCYAPHRELGATFESAGYRRPWRGSARLYERVL